VAACPRRTRGQRAARPGRCRDRTRLARDVRLLSASLARLSRAVRDGADEDLSTVFGRIAQLLGD
jgi:hypothetical protein